MANDLTSRGNYAFFFLISNEKEKEENMCKKRKTGDKSRKTS